MNIVNICVAAIGNYCILGALVACLNNINVRKRNNLSEKIQKLRKELFENGLQPFDLEGDLHTIGFDGNWAREILLKEWSFWEISQMPTDALTILMMIAIIIGWPKFIRKIFFDRTVLRINYEAAYTASNDVLDIHKIKMGLISINTSSKTKNERKTP